MRICPNCHQENPDLAKFCLGCGTNIGHPLKVMQSETLDQGERRQMTILFCDLVDSTPLSERMDPEDYRQMILDYHNAAEMVIQRHGGKVGNYLGDGLLVYFGYPEGLENAAIAGVRTALAIIDSLETVKEQWEDPQKQVYVKLRVGIHTGVVIVDDHLALGETVNLAARLEGFAPHNGVVVSSTTHKLIQDWFEMESLGKKNLKGISEPMEIFEIRGKTGAKTRLDAAKKRGLSPLVGRKMEIQRLRKHWEQALERKASSLMLVGEAGIGKSRLSDKFEEEVRRTQENTVLEARCSMHHTNSAFYPLLEVFQNDLLDIKESDQTLERLDKLEFFFKEHVSGKEEQIPLFAEYLGISGAAYPPLTISPFAKRAKILDSISDVFLELAAKKPLLFVIEDLHWADASTLEWLESFKNALGDNMLFLLCTSRPHPKGDSKILPSIDLIELTRLEAGNTAQICQYQSGGKQLPEDLLRKIIEKTEGVPLFVEELTKMVLDSNRIEEKEDRYELIGPLATLDIPSTLQDSLLARLDQLKDVKDIVQMGSVIGREFSLNMLEATLPEHKIEMTSKIQKLLNAEIFQNSDKDMEHGLRFKHALIQDTAYGSMLRNRRRQMHQKVATVLQADFTEICETQPEKLAHHLTEADQPSLAIPQWLLAGQVAKKTNATQEGIAHLKKGLELLPRLKDKSVRKSLELDLLLTLGGTYMVSHGFPHPLVKETFNKAKNIAETMEISPKLALIHVGLIGYYFNTEDYFAYDELADHMISLSEDPTHGYWFKLLGNHFKGTSIVRGNFREAHEHFELATEIFDPSLPFPWELTPSGYLPFATKGWWMICLQIMGFHYQANRISLDHLNSREKFRDSDSMTLYHIHTFPALFNLEAREWKSAQHILETYLPIVREFGDPVFTLTAQVYYQIAKFFQGEKESFDETVHLINVCFEIGFKAFAVTMSSFIAEGYLMYGDPQGSIQWIDKILDHVNKTKTHIQTAELHRLRARGMFELGKSRDEVEKQYQQALKIAKEQGALTFEIRAAMDLGRFWHTQGKTEQAHALIKACYDRFTEGFESVDLKVARDLMKALEGQMHP